MATLRARILLISLPLFALGLVLSTVHVPRGQEAVWTRGPRAGHRLDAGWQLRWPVLEGVARVPRGSFSCSGEAEELTREGAKRQRAWRVSARASAQAWRQAARSIDPGRPCASVAPLMARSLGMGAISVRESMRAALVDAGLEVQEAWTGEPEAAPGEGRQPAPPAAADARPVLIIALDGADWQVLDPLIQAGQTPNLARLKRDGAWAALHSNAPMLSPLLWTTAATGRPPEEHGIVDFLIRDPRTGARVPISSNFRRTKALWNILTDAGVASDWVGWWATWPAERIIGHMVSDRVAYSLFDYTSPDSVGATWPPALLEEIRPPGAGTPAPDDALLRRLARADSGDLARSRQRASAAPRLAYADPLLHLARILESTATYHRAVLRLLAKGPAALTAVYYQGIDEIGHRFAHCAPPRMTLCSDADFLRYRDTLAQFYAHQDALVGELLARVRPGTVTIVLSDHGFLSGSERPEDLLPDIEGRPGEWHRAYGIFMAHGEGIAAGRIGTVSLYDIAPTILQLMGLPAGADMRGEVLAFARRARAATAARIASWEPIGAPSAPGGDAPASVYDGEVIARLRSLGYVQGGDRDEPEASGAPPSPQSRVDRESQPAAPAGAGGATYHTNLGALYLNRAEPARAETEFRRALELRSAHPDAADGLARALLAQGRGAEARSLLERLVRDGGGLSPRTWLVYASACREDGRQSEGLVFLERHRTASCLPRVARARLLRDRQDPGAAESALRAALREEPGCIEAVEDLFRLLEETRQAERLDALMAAALAERPDSPRLLGLESLRLKARGDLAGSERVLRRALNLAPDDPMLLTSLGSLLGIGGRLEQAADLLRDIVRRFPHLLEARVNLGAALGKQGRVPEAIAVFEEARQIGHASPALLNAMALAYAQNRQTAEAIRALEKSLSVDGDQPVARSMLHELRLGS
jgi:predicted AlkP superfamily phosphohydrolase/phosphomutase/Flp pilus assembly protein TadD